MAQWIKCLSHKCECVNSGILIPRTYVKSLETEIPVARLLARLSSPQTIGTIGRACLNKLSRELWKKTPKSTAWPSQSTHMSEHLHPHVHYIYVNIHIHIYMQTSKYLTDIGPCVWGGCCITLLFSFVVQKFFLVCCYSIGLFFLL